MARNTACGFLALIVGLVGSAFLLQQPLFVPLHSCNAVDASSNMAARCGSSLSSSAQHASANQKSRWQFSMFNYPVTLVGLLGTGAIGLVGSRAKQVRCLKSRMNAFDATLQEGVTEPLGFFDPLGFTKGKDEKEFRKLRIAEIKHGRVAMMASIGMVLPHFFKFPGFEEVPSGIGAVFTTMGGAGFGVLVFGAGLHELVLWKDDESKDPGDFGDPFKFGEQITVERNYELNNGRMAMFAVVGQIVAELVTGKDAVGQLGL